MGCDKEGVEARGRASGTTLPLVSRDEVNKARHSKENGAIVEHVPCRAVDAATTDRRTRPKPLLAS